MSHHSDEESGADNMSDGNGRRAKEGAKGRQREPKEDVPNMLCWYSRNMYTSILAPQETYDKMGKKRMDKLKGVVDRHLCDLYDKLFQDIKADPVWKEIADAECVPCTVWLQ